jgi:hypothetical protein
VDAIVSSLILRHTRHHTSPTRRVAVERFTWPEERAPHAPGVLLAGVAVANLPYLDEGLLDRWDDLIGAIAKGEPLPPRALRHRIQTDIVGLDRSEHRLVMHGKGPLLEIDRHGPALPQLVGVLSATAGLRGQRRRTALSLLRTAKTIGWNGGRAVAADLFRAADASVVDAGAPDAVSPEAERALLALGFGAWERPSRSQVLGAFRRLVRAAHPDHGGDTEMASERVAELDTARRFLLESAAS